MRSRFASFAVFVFFLLAWGLAAEPLLSCGEAIYSTSQYTCYDSFLCPILDGTPTLRCGADCYLPSRYSCSNGHLIYPPTATSSAGPSVPGSTPRSCSAAAVTQHLSDPPYENYFYSDCQIAAQVIVTSPQPDSNLTIIGPQLVVVWPAGNSGVCAFFAPADGVNGSLAIEIRNNTSDGALSPIYKPATGSSEYPSVGVSGVLRFNSSATLTVPILGGVRTIRDFTEGPSLLQPPIQDAIQVKELKSGAVMSRLWLDNITTTELGFMPMSANSRAAVTIDNKTINFEAGEYLFYADFNYPQLAQLNSSAVLNEDSQGLVDQQPDQTTSLLFLSYSEKLLAGAWRFLTYFGRDSMIAALLLKPVLSQGKGSAVEAVIGAVLERINRTDGSVAHEETLGDYATYLHQQMNVTSTAPSYTYQMIDTDFYLPIVMDQYFLQTSGGSNRIKPFLQTVGGSVNPINKNLTWGQLALMNAEKIMAMASRFATKGNQTLENLVHLKEDQIVGQWRDSTYGIGGGRIPYDVNTALVPAALRSIVVLSRAGLYEGHSDWTSLAESYAKVWEDETLKFFEVNIPVAEAKSRLGIYTKRSSFGGPVQDSLVDDDIAFHAISLDGYDNLKQVQVMNTDDCFRLFLVNSTNQSQLTSLLNQSANNVMRTFPAGLSTPIGLLVANPAYGEDPVYAANWSTSAYHGTVVWSWQQAMMARGFELQLDRCNRENLEYCENEVVYTNVLRAYNSLWDTIEANGEYLSAEVWSWVYDGGFKFTPIGALPPPLGTSPTESDIRQLWSLTFLAVKRNISLAL